MTKRRRNETRRRRASAADGRTGDHHQAQGHGTATLRAAAGVFRSPGGRAGVAPGRRVGCGASRRVGLVCVRGLNERMCVGRWSRRAAAGPACGQGWWSVWAKVTSGGRIIATLVLLANGRKSNETKDETNFNGYSQSFQDETKRITN